MMNVNDLNYTLIKLGKAVDGVADAVDKFDITWRFATEEEWSQIDRLHFLAMDVFECYPYVIGSFMGATVFAITFSLPFLAWLVSFLLPIVVIHGIIQKP